MPAMTPAFAGAAIGLAVAAPIGPAGLLCIHRTLAHGIATGLTTGLGFATAHALYGTLAAIGITLADQGNGQFIIRLLGSMMLMYIALKALRGSPFAVSAPAGRQHARSYATALTFALCNPTTLLAFALMVPGLIGRTAYTGTNIALFVVGIFIGSVVWWATLSTAVALARQSLTASRLRIMNRLTGCILAGMAMLLLVHAISHLRHNVTG